MPLQVSTAGSKWQKRGSEINPSFTPSIVSQAAITAFWMRARLVIGIALGESASWACSFQTRPAPQWDQSLPGSPTRMPSKSSGKRCAIIKASRPPSEHPKK